MAVSVENTGALARRLTVSVPSEQVEGQVHKKMLELARKAHIKGYRPGKVPLPVLQKKFGGSVRAEVIQEIIQVQLGEALEAHAIRPAASPHIEDLQAEQGKDLTFTANLEIFPEITLADFSQLTVEKRQVEIQDANLRWMIEKLRDQLAQWKAVERPVKEGDKLTVDFARQFEKEDERQEQKQVQLMAGGKGALPGLNEALYNHVVGDEIEVSSQYPEDWAESSVAGKQVVLWVTIHKIEEKHLLTDAELEEKLAKMELGISAEDSVAAEGALEAKVQALMQKELEKVLAEEQREAMLEKLLEANPMELPKSLIEKEKQAVLKEMSRTDLDTPEQAAEVEAQAKRRVELGLLLNEVIKTYDIKADATRVRAKIQDMFQRYGQSQALLEAYYNNRELLHGVERMVLLDQAVELMLQKVQLKEVKASFEEVMNVASDSQ